MPDVLPIPLAYNTAYLWEGNDTRILIDTGPDFEGSWELLQSALGGDPPDLVVATHGHIDHAGLGRRWQDSGVPVALTKADVRLARVPMFADDSEFDALYRFVEGCGAPVEVQSVALAGLEGWRDRSTEQAQAGYRPAGRAARYPSALRMDPFEPEIVLAGDTTLPGGLRAISAPGHTRGNIVLWDTREGWLFSGDQLLEDIAPTPGIQWVPEHERGLGATHGTDGANGDADWRFRSLPAFARSLTRIKRLGTERCYPGHGMPFDDVEDVIEANLEQIAARTERVRDARDGAVSVYELCERLYPRAARRRLWQIIATIQGHLDLLEAEPSGG